MVNARHLYPTHQVQPAMQLRVYLTKWCISSRSLVAVSFLVQNSCLHSTQVGPAHWWW
uniref:Uncharacterized protein n=1 Tax=Anguilla anguilla TaxID=7936 RepID=A0A0E9R9A9_ANGAN